MTKSWLTILFFSILLALLGTPVTANPLAQTPPVDQCAAGLDFFYDGDGAAALPLLEAGYAGFEELDLSTIDLQNDGNTAGDCALVLCAIRMETGVLEDAVDACLVALDIYAGLGDRLRGGIAYNTIGRVYAIQNDTIAALAAFEQALDAALATDNGIGAVIALNNMGVLYRDQGRLPEAQEAFELALEMAGELNDADGVRSALTGLGRVYKAHGRYADALAVLEEALTISQENDNPQGEISALIFIADVLEAQGAYGDALAHYEEALAIANKIDDIASEGTILGQIASVYWAQGYYPDALDLYEQALARVRQTNDRGQEGHLLNGLGLVFEAQGRYREALGYFEEALAIARELNDADEEAAALHNLGLVYSAQGQFAEALVAYEQALGIVRRTGFRAEESVVLNSMATVFDAQGRYTEALPVYEEALAIAQELGNQDQVGNVLNNIGYAYYELGRYEDAIIYYTEALEIAQAGGDRAEEAKRLNNLAVVYDILGEYSQALAIYDEVLEIERALDNRDGVVTALNNLGAVYFSQGLDAEARPYVEEALTMAREMNDPVMLSRLLANLGKLLAALGESDAALEYYLESMDVVESVRAVAGSEAGRAGFAERFVDVYSAAIALYIQSGQEEQAFLTSEQARSRAFLDALATGQVELSDSTAADLLARQQELYAQRVAAQDALASATAANPADPVRIESAQAAFAEVDAAYSALLDSIAARNDQLRELVPGRNTVLDVAAVQAQLDPDTTLLSFYVLDGEAWGGEGTTLAFVLTQESFETVELPNATPELLRDTLEELQLWLNLEDAHPQPLLDLHNWLIDPLLDQIHTPKLGIVPHQMLHYAPIAALSDGESYLSDRFTLFVLPSASALPYILQNASRAVDSQLVDAAPLIYGNPSTDAQLALLVYAEEEARAVSALLDAPVYTEEEASESRLWSQVEGARILHLAAHGSYNQANPLYSAIYLAPDRSEDGRLEVHEVYGLKLAANELVVLSACKTNLGDLSAGDEVVGLTRAFFFAGSPTVIASLWSVDDLATKELMLAFYNGLDAGLSKGEALRAAQSHVRATYPSPYYWAAFVLNGDPGATTDANVNMNIAVPVPDPVTESSSTDRGADTNRRDGTTSQLPAWLIQVVEKVRSYLP